MTSCEENENNGIAGWYSEVNEDNTQDRVEKDDKNEPGLQHLVRDKEGNNRDFKNKIKKKDTDLVISAFRKLKGRY